MNPGSELRALVRGERPWTGHDVLVVTVPDAGAGERHRQRLEGLFRATPLRIEVVEDPRRLGNLTGTIEAWRAVHERVGAAERVAIVHDAGQATRTGWVTRSTGGSRGALRLGSSLAGHPVDLLGLVAIAAMGWASDPDRIDVFWGSQLCLAERLGVAEGRLCKVGRPIAVDAVGDAELADLGWLAVDERGLLVDFAPRGRFTEVGPFQEWARRFPSVLADLGSSGFTRELLDELAREPVQRRDLDPDFTAHRVGSGEIGVRAFEGAWVRFRRPDEIRRGLCEAVPGMPGMRALWGVSWPVERSWLGDVWVEGPELGWEAVAAGATIGGVELVGSVVRDAALEPGSTVRRSWLWACSGRIEADRSALVEVEGPGRYEGELACAPAEPPVRMPSEAALAVLEAAPAGSDPASWARLFREGRLVLRRGEGGVVAPRGVARGELWVPTERWPGLARIPSEVQALLDGLSVLADPAASGISAEGLVAGPVPNDPIAAIDRWEPAADPLRVDLARWMAEVGAGPIADAAGFRVAWRVALERDGRTVPEAWASIRARMAEGLGARLLAADLAFDAGGPLLPVFRFPPPTTGELAEAIRGTATWRDGGVLGIAGPCAAGKSVLVSELLADPRAAHLPADPLAWEGPGFRYVQHERARTELFEGPGIYDHRGIAAAIAAARAPGRVVVVDGVFLGLDAHTRAAIDTLVLLVAHPAVRLRDKRIRDRGPDAVRRIDVDTDFARKLFREDRDAIGRIPADLVGVRIGVEGAQPRPRPR